MSLRSNPSARLPFALCIDRKDKASGSGASLNAGKTP
jgi:hypothetical protein